MANNVQQYQQQQQQQQQQQGTNGANPHHCKECGLYLNSAESLEVHLQYHKENLMNKWASPEETNNNTTGGASSKVGPTTSPSASSAAGSGGGGGGGQQTSGNSNSSSNGAAAGAGGVVGGVFASTVAATADSSDAMMKKSPEYSRATPENNFGHPPTPQSYHSASSPYQTPENSAFSPGFQSYQQQPIKTERSSPTFQYPTFQDAQFFNLDQPQQQQQQQQSYAQDYPVHKMPSQNSFRYHPYQQAGPYERPVTQVTSSSPAYPPQPTPSPSPKQCDKCGYVCESASQLIEHINVAHPPTPAPHLGNYQFNFPLQPSEIKTEDDAQSEILDLDSHKVVHQVYQEEEKSNPHSVNAMLSSWPQHLQQKMYLPQQQQQQQDQRMMMFQQQDYITTTGAPQDAYRPFDHLQPPPQQSAPTITSTQVVNQPVVVAPPPVNAKSTNWKSNEARRPKTYNCTACNKWFTSSGHLKRHYNTTLHKNAVKSSGQPDPATLPISAHHHPARESTSSRENEMNSNSPTEDSRSEDGYERAVMPQGLLQQPPNGPYDRHHHPMGLGPSPLQAPPPPPQQNTMGTSPPNGEAGPSATTNNLDSRGLLSTTNTTSTNSINNSQDSNTTTTNHLHQQHLTTTNNTGHPQQQQYTLMGQQQPLMDNSQFQMYPNECAPHVTQVTATNSLSTTGEADQFNQEYSTTTTASDSQPLPSFSQFNNRFGLLMEYNTVANVGGPGPATAPYTSYYSTTATTAIAAAPGSFESFRGNDDGDYKLTVLTAAETDPLTAVSQLQQQQQHHHLLQPLHPQHLHQQQLHYLTDNNNIALATAYADIEPKVDTLEDLKIKFATQPLSPEKAHTKRDYEETTGSPQITSTSTTVQVSKNGLHKCYDCDKVFNKSCYLTQHNKTFHNGEKPFKCTRCGKRFSCNEQYQEHSSKHAGEKPHKCELCPKQFNHKTDLRRHMCLHTGQKPYACDTCGKGFIRKDHMLKHSEIHNKKPHSKISISAR